MKLKTWTVGNGPRTAVLVHGASKSADVWRDFARILVDEYDMTVMLLDQRGHGQSPRADRYHIEDFVNDLVETLPTGLDFYIGSSLGALAGAWGASKLQPKHFIGLDPGFVIGPPFLVMALFFQALGPFKHRVNDWMLNIPGAIPKGSAPDTLERVRVMTKQWEMSMMVQAVRSAQRRPFPVQPPAVPSTLVLAENSIVVPQKMAEELSAVGWDIRVKPGAVHDLHLQDPAGVIAMLDDVLRAKPEARR